MTTSQELPDFLRKSPRFFSGRRKVSVILAGGALVLLIGLWVFGGEGAPQGNYLTEAAAVDDLVVSISANGTLAPTRSVDVGSELSGTIEAVLVEENDRVRKGQIVVRLDTAKLQDAVTKSRAAVTVAEAAVHEMEATALEARANLARLRHVAELSGGKVPAQSELQTAEAAGLRAEANVDSAKAAVVQARAALKTDATNLAKAVIRAPINGVVLTRKVEPGQTVAAQMTTPVLLTLAEDLTQMELQVKVDEADVGTVKLGQTASFNVAAWGNRNFPARIKRIGIGATTTDNVVTYKTILSVDNRDLALRPGMTATARIVTARRDKALLVPNTALRFSPTVGNGKAGQGASFLSRLVPRPPRQEGRKNGAAPHPATGAGQVWVLQDGRPLAVAVEVGLSNGKLTEITGGDLKPGMAVITDYQEKRR